MMDYIEEPAEPAYDYYYDADGNLVYLEEGASHTLLAGEEYRDGTSIGIVNSITVELPYREEDKLIIASMILSKIGINLKVGEITNFAELFKSQVA
jgi:hypothetical protein